MTWERHRGSIRGFSCIPYKSISITGAIFDKQDEITLPGLSNFSMTGQSVTSAGALFMNRKAIRTIYQNVYR